MQRTKDGDISGGKTPKEERQTIVAAAQNSWEIATFASVENDQEAWKEIFGPRFKTEED